MNKMEIDGHIAIISYDEEIDMFRGEFVDLNGGADFYACDIEGLHKEGSISLRVFLDACQVRGLESYKKFSGKLSVRLAPDLHARATSAAKSRGESLNQFIANALEQAGRAFDLTQC